MIFLYFKNRRRYRRENWYLDSPLKIKKHVFYHFSKILLSGVKSGGEFFYEDTSILKAEDVIDVEIDI